MVKVGDRVRNTDNRMYFTEGREYEVLEADYYTYRVLDDDGDGTWLKEDEPGFETVSDTSEELAELRAFKARAIAKHPDLKEPETVDEAADYFREKVIGGGLTVRQALVEAIAWARANRAS